MWNIAVTEIVLYIFRIPIHREESTSKNNKRITMAQYENDHWKDSFINRAQYPINSCNFWIPTPSRTESYDRCQISVLFYQGTLSLQLY